jgi:hypothetical protein
MTTVARTFSATLRSKMSDELRPSPTTLTHASRSAALRRSVKYFESKGFEGSDPAPEQQRLRERGTLIDIAGDTQHQSTRGGRPSAAYRRHRITNVRAS